MLLRMLSKHLQANRSNVISDIANALEAAGANQCAAQKVVAKFRTKKQREAVLLVAELFSSIESLAEARNDLNELSHLLSAPPPANPNQKKSTKKPAAKKQAPAKQADTEFAAMFSKNLASASLDRLRFVELHHQLKDSKKVNTPTLHCIAQRFLGNKTVYSGRKQALDEILRRHHDSLRVAEQDRILDRLE